jgi:multiple sugar transport system permease protein
VFLFFSHFSQVEHHCAHAFYRHRQLFPIDTRPVILESDCKHTEIPAVAHSTAVVVSLFLAELLNRKIRAISFFRSSFFLPVIVSGVVVTILWQQLFGFDSGLINRMLSGVGLHKVGWLVNPDLAIYSIAVMATWKNVGLYVILFLVGLQTVPPQYYEAAKLEGAGRWQQFYHITLPMINPTIFLVVILSTIGGFNLFIEPYIMTGGGPLNQTLSAVLYIYKQAFQYYNMGYSATLGFFYALMIMTVVVLQKKFIEREE